MYTTKTELLEEGLDPVVTTARADKAINLATDYIDLMTGQFFELREKTFRFDAGRKVYYFPIFCSSVTEAKEDGSLIDPEDFTLYNRFFPDDRLNPKIVFDFRISGIPGAGRARRSFIKKELLLDIKGQFGYVEEDQTTPRLIKKAARKLALMEVNKLTGEDRNDILDRNRIVSENTDGHSYSLGFLINSAKFTGDPEIDGILSSYARPLDIA